MELRSTCASMIPRSSGWTTRVVIYKEPGGCWFPVEEAGSVVGLFFIIYTNSTFLNSKCYSVGMHL